MLRLRKGEEQPVSMIYCVCVCVIFPSSSTDQGTDQDIQTYTIAVINALFLKAPEEKRQVREFPISSTVCVCVCMMIYL